MLSRKFEKKLKLRKRKKSGIPESDNGSDADADQKDQKDQENQEDQDQD